MLDPLREIAATRYPDLALSLYLPAGPPLDARFHDALMKDLEKGEAQHLDERRLDALHREFSSVRSFLADVPPPGKPLAVLSCLPANLFEAYWLPEEAEPAVWIEERLHLAPLLEQATRHPAAYVVVVDKEQARIFATFLQNVQEIASVRGQPIKHHKQGGWSAEKHQRHEQQYVEWQLKAAAQWLARLDPNGKIRLYLAGPTETRAAFRKDLPKALQQAIVKEFPAPLYLSSGELAERLKSAT